jgi:hypothetical protein
MPVDYVEAGRLFAGSHRAKIIILSVPLLLSLEGHSFSSILTLAKQ